MEPRNLYEVIRTDYEEKEVFEKAKQYSFDYLDTIGKRDVTPTAESMKELQNFEEELPNQSCSSSEILELLHRYGSENTVMTTGGKYFGFVCGSSLPVSLAAKWLSDVWDQNCGLYVMSPIAAKLEELCERWVVSLLQLPKDTAAGFVSGSSSAIICALTAARNSLLQKQNWDVAGQGLFGAPQIKVVLGEQAHSSVFKALALLGLGKDRVTLVPVDDQGRMLPEKLPALDASTLLIVQAGNVNSGAFDPLDELCEKAEKAGAWVHVDGAFGLWAAASNKYSHLTRGIEKADSWSVDAHKTLNVPYDSGIVLCRDRNALVGAMQASGSYIQYSEHRDGMLYTTEMSRRARSIELWAALKYLGRQGVQELIDMLCENAVYFADRLSECGFTVLNDVVFNQILIKGSSDRSTKQLLTNIQNSGKCWCGGAVWKMEPVIRISVCSWQTTKQDIDECVEVFKACYKES